MTKLAGERTTAINSRLPQWGQTWLNQVQCFYQHLCLVDNLVLRPPLRQAATRYASCQRTLDNIKKHE